MDLPHWCRRGTLFPRVAVGREAEGHVASQQAAVAQRDELVPPNPLAGHQPRQDEVKNRLVGEHLAGGETEDWDCPTVGEPEQAARVGRYAVLLDGRASLAERHEQWLEWVERAGARGHDDFGLPVTGAVEGLDEGLGTVFDSLDGH